MWVGGLLGVGGGGGGGGGGGKGYVGPPLKLLAPPPSYAYEAPEQQNNGHQT